MHPKSQHYPLKRLSVEQLEIRRLLTACPAGQYSATGQTPCINSPAGYYVPTIGATSPTPASPGHYQPSIGQSTQLTAPAGRYAPLSAMTSPLIATPGHYVPSSGATFQFDASPGNYVSSSGATSQTPASPGSYVPTSAATSQTAASPGHYVPSSGASSQTNASPGYYVAGSAATAQTAAPIGYFVPGVAATAPIAASPGYYVPTTAATAQTPASPGYYVPSTNASSQILDPIGTTSPAASATYVAAKTVALDAQGNLQLLDMTQSLANSNNDALVASWDNINSRFVFQDDFNLLTTSIAGATGVGTYRIDVNWQLANQNPSLSIDGGLGNDKSTIDLSNKPSNLSTTMNVVGGGGSDTLAIAGGLSSDTAMVYASADSGNVARLGSSIGFSTTEDIVLLSPATTMQFTLPANVADLVLSDDSSSGNSLTQLASSSSAIPRTSFQATTQLTIVGSGTASETLTVDALPDLNIPIALGTSTQPLGSLIFRGDLKTGGTRSVTAIASSVSVGSSATVNFQVGGTLSGSANGYQPVISSGVTTLANSTLVLGSLNGFVPSHNARFTVIRNSSNTATTGTFRDLPEGALLPNVLNSGFDGVISYHANTDGGSIANDVVITLNQAPNDLALNNASLEENAGANASVGILTGADTDLGDILSFSLPTGLGSNSLFNISGTSLRANDSFDFESGTSFPITVRVTDSGGLTFDKSFSISISNVNEAPSDVNLSSSSITESVAVGTSVGSLQSTDPDAGNAFTYALASGGIDNAAFTIDAVGAIHSAVALNYEAKPTYNIRVRSTDQGGLFFEKDLTIQVINLLEVNKPIQIGDGTAQRSIVKQLMVSFDQTIAVDPGAFVVQQRVKTASNTLQLNNVVTNVALAPLAGGGTKATLTFAGAYTMAGSNALVDGNYQLTIDGSKIRTVSTNSLLDADNDGLAGGTRVLGANALDNFYALLGDMNGNGEVDAQDLLGINNAYRSRVGQANYNAAYDINGNGQVDAQDLLAVQNNYRKKRAFF